MTNLKKLLLISLIACCLQGCALVAVGGAAAAATYFIMHDKRSTKTKNTDEVLVESIRAKLNEEPVFRQKANITIAAFHGDVLLLGQAPTHELKRQAARIASTAHGIRRLYNEINIKQSSSTLSNIQDDWISMRVRSLLSNDKSLRSIQIKVITEYGVVYLMGRATAYQQRKITNLVRNVPNVKKVVKIFS